MTRTIRSFPARVIARALPVADLRDLVGANLGEVEPFFWAAEISSNRLDAYFTHMAESTLRNFSADSAAGVPFLDSHNHRALGYGQSLSGTLEINGEISRVVSDFYTVPGIRFRNGVTYESTDDFIKAVNARLVRDVSVGFHGGDTICDICGNSFYDWRNCDHWPGEEYAVGERGEETVVATFAIEEANLSEVSGVYDGATPQAQIIQRAQEMHAAGLMPPETARRLETQYRIKLPAQPTWSVSTALDSGSTDQVSIGTYTIRGASEQPESPFVTLNTNETGITEEGEKMEELEQVQALLAEAGAEGETVIEQARHLVGEVARLTPLADQGRQYREDVIAEAMTEGVRALGDAFPAETYKNMLATAPLEHIRQLRDAWRKQGNERLGGGRKTNGGDEVDPEPARIVPDHAYKS